MSPNYALRTARESLNLSMQEVADGARVSFRTVQRAEKGHPLNPGSRRHLCDFFAQFGITAEELCLVPQRRQSGVAQQPSGSLDVSEAVVRGMLVAVRNLDQEEIDMNRSRRFFLQMLGVAGTALIIAPKELLLPSTALTNSPITEVSVSTIENFAAITQQYRSLQLAGFATEDVLRSHISLIQKALENTVNDKYRCDLWRILAQSQILARHSVTKKQELGRARTWNEAAIASAQYSGDALLLGAAIGHLGHLCLTWQHDPLSARKLLDQAQDYTHGHPVNGWFAMVVAAIAAEEENRSECETSVARALERLTSMNLEALAENRHASAFYDISCAHAATGELEAMEVYAFRSIDKALTTNRFYILPRFVTLAQKIQAKDHHESHAAAVAEYAHVALHQ